MPEGLEKTRLETKAPPLAREQMRLRKACADFEALLTVRMLSAMREATVAAEEPSHARGIYESMMDQAVAEALARSGEAGLGELLYRSLAGRLGGGGGKGLKESPGSSDLPVGR